MDEIDLIKAVNNGIDRREPKMWPRYDGDVYDRSKVVTASEIGYCARKVRLDKDALRAAGAGIGVTKTKSTDDWGFFERGHTIEAWFVEQIVRGWHYDDWTLHYTGDDQVSFVVGSQGGTPDGVLRKRGADDVAILEVKSIDPRTNRSRLPKKPHVDQVMQNLDLVAHQMELSPVGGLLIYIDASNYKIMQQVPILWDNDHAGDLFERADWVLETEAHALPAEGVYTGDCAYCAHTHVCSAMIRSEKNGESYDEELKKASKGIFG